MSVIESCTYETPNVDTSVAASLLIIHNKVNINTSSSKPKPSMVYCPRIGRDCNKEA